VAEAELKKCRHGIEGFCGWIGATGPRPDTWTSPPATTTRLLLTQQRALCESRSVGQACRRSEGALVG